MNTAFIQALCNTFLHSLWQGFAAALLTGVILVFTRRSSPVKRYYLLLAVFILFITAAGITFYMELPVQSSTVIPQPQDISTVAIISSGTEISGTGQFLSYFSKHAPLIVSVWFIIFLMKLIHLLTGLVTIQRMRHYKASKNKDWEKQLNTLASSIGITKYISLLESAMAKVPQTAGFFKPVIFLPAGVLTGLPTDEIEAILLHELAHIKRNDFLVNLLQCLAETIFFFNPALLWISSLLRKEREYCCDEMALNAGRNKTTYIKALVSFQEYSNGIMAIGFAARKGHLLDRVKRMVTSENRKLNTGEKTVLLLSTIALMILVTSLKAPAKENNSALKKEIHTSISNPLLKDVVIERPLKKQAGIMRPVTPREQRPKNIETAAPVQIAGNSSDANTVRKEEEPVIKKDTIPSFPSISSHINDDGTTRNEEITAKDDKGNVYRYKRLNGRITELLVNDKLVAGTEYPKYTAIIDAINYSRELNIAKGEERRAMLKESRFKADSIRQQTFERKQQMLHSYVDSARQKHEVENKRNQEAMSHKIEWLRNNQDSILKKQKQIIRQQDSLRRKKLVLTDNHDFNFDFKLKSNMALSNNKKYNTTSPAKL
ncbi:MAG: hypothetical protein JWN76_2609 [Chitinophagaceae bacterium]|nr:hypothetical protein [Chitinophagaceae bacterium]